MVFVELSRRLQRSGVIARQGTAGPTGIAAACHLLLCLEVCWWIYTRFVHGLPSVGQLLTVHYATSSFGHLLEGNCDISGLCDLLQSCWYHLAGLAWVCCWLQTLPAVLQ